MYYGLGLIVLYDSKYYRWSLQAFFSFPTAPPAVNNACNIFVEETGMADFHQSGVVTTLHRLNSNANARVESELESLSAKNPIGLVLPALYSEFETPSMRRIVQELRQAPYLRDIVVVLARATRSEYEQARS